MECPKVCQVYPNTKGVERMSKCENCTASFIPRKEMKGCNRYCLACFRFNKWMIATGRTRWIA